MYKKRTFLTVLVVALFACLLLSGCGGSGGNNIPESELEQQANSVVTNYLQAMENENTNQMGEYMSSDFIHRTSGSSETLNKGQYLSLFDLIFSSGGSYSDVSMPQRTNVIVSSTVVKISGDVNTSGIDIDGYSFNNTSFAQFTVENRSGTWYIIELID